jgi:spermidine synthase
LAFKTNAERVLVVGLGGGSIPKKYHKEFPAMAIDVAEIDPEVIEVAKKHFSFKETPTLRAYAQDGRLFITRTKLRYDIILLDAYFRDAVPFHLTTREFFATAGQKLSPDGVVVINLIGAVTGPRGRITRSVAKTLGGIFPQVYIFATRRPQNVSLDSIQNVIVVATRDSRRLETQEILKRAAAIGRDLFPRPLSDVTAAYYDGKLPDGDVPLLTDDYAPTDNLLHP